MVNGDAGQQKEFFVDIVGWLETAWGIYKRSWTSYSLVSFVLLTVVFVAGYIPFVGGLLVVGPLTAGYYMAIGEIVSGKPADLSTLFRGFIYFVPAFVANLLISIFSTIGFVLLVIPGFVVGGFYIFTYLFMVDRGSDFWTSMESSRAVAMNDVVGFALFYLTLGAINVLGIICFFVGLLVTIPVSGLAVLVAYEKLVGFDTMLKEADNAPGAEKPSGSDEHSEPKI